MAASADIEEVAARVVNWQRWGPDDEAGTVNYITEDKTAAAARLVRHGRVVALGIPLGQDGPQINGGIRFNPLHFMTALHSHDLRPDGSGFADDVLTLPLQAATQWDALAHVSYNGRMYGGRPASRVTTRGAEVNAISSVSARIATRGVLLDMARHLGLDSLEPGQAIGVADLESAEAAAGVRVGEGDALLVRTGFLERCRKDRWAGFEGASPGLDVETIEWLHDRRVAAVAADTCFVEVRPSTVPGMRGPFHVLGIVYMGLLVGEIFDLEELGRDCHEDGVHEFLFVAPPLAVSGGVGSPVNPYAVK